MPRYCPPFSPMHGFYRDGEEVRGMRIDLLEVTEEMSRLQRIRGSMSMTPGEWRDFEAGTYVRLLDDGRKAGDRLIMSDTPMERATNLEFVRYAHGRVLIGGLGIGMILLPVLAKPEVAEAVVVEHDLRVIELINTGERFKGCAGIEKLTIRHDDIVTMPQHALPAPWDTIYFDIWPEIDAGNHQTMVKLHRRWATFKNIANPRAFATSWRKEEVYRLAAEERRWA